MGDRADRCGPWPSLAAEKRKTCLTGRHWPGSCRASCSSASHFPISRCLTLFPSLHRVCIKDVTDVERKQGSPRNGWEGSRRGAEDGEALCGNKKEAFLEEEDTEG